MYRIKYVVSFNNLWRYTSVSRLANHPSLVQAHFSPRCQLNPHAFSSVTKAGLFLLSTKVDLSQC